LDLRLNSKRWKDVPYFVLEIGDSRDSLLQPQYWRELDLPEHGSQRRIIESLVVNHG